MLELGSGLGVAGLSCALLHPHLRLTLSDYDPAVLRCLAANIEASGISDRVNATSVDFRDFGPPANAHGNGDAAVPAALAPYAARGLLGSFDCILASDVVYDAYHGQRLPWLCGALLRATPGARALLISPDSRPRLDELVASAPAAGFSCRVERLRPSARLRQRLEEASDGWGADNAFSLYVLERA